MHTHVPCRSREIADWSAGSGVLVTAPHCSIVCGMANGRSLIRLVLDMQVVCLGWVGWIGRCLLRGLCCCGCGLLDSGFISKKGGLSDRFYLLNKLAACGSYLFSLEVSSKSLRNIALPFSLLEEVS